MYILVAATSPNQGPGKVAFWGVSRDDTPVMGY
jgi:hypothetical protein